MGRSAPDPVRFRPDVEVECDLGHLGGLEKITPHLTPIPAAAGRVAVEGETYGIEQGGLPGPDPRKAQDLLKRGTVLVDSNDTGQSPRMLFYLEHSILDGATLPDGSRRTISREMHFVEISESGDVRDAGCAPYLDYRPLKEEEFPAIASVLEADWLRTDSESKILEYAVTHLVPRHFNRVRQRKEDLVDRTLNAVQDRLTKEISHWDFRAEELRQQEAAGAPQE